MFFLYEKKTLYRPCEISKELNMPNPSVRRILADLWKEKFVSRFPNKQYRVTAYHMTALIFDLREEREQLRNEIKKMVQPIPITMDIKVQW